MFLILPRKQAEEASDEKDQRESSTIILRYSENERQQFRVEDQELLAGYSGKPLSELSAAELEKLEENTK